ncbi:conserved hypothetical protein [Rhodococcus phage E3]|uniref:HicB-like antitoxin n=1 Tax=Rhodococcus phage E3 TaxID=1007869 RepID=UPI0002C6AD53|nr:HicB-like antitoxin [Rhodococcus phage E3]AEQ20933.1 conserved hypothetical protein [Rhodococcus phage E3]
MMTTNYYHVTATREGKWWEISVMGLDEVTQARKVADIEQNARELIAVTKDVPIDEVRVGVELVVDGLDQVAQRAGAIHLTRERAEALRDEATAAAEKLAKELEDAGVPMRDIGTILGLSHQRVHQILSPQ